MSFVNLEIKYVHKRICPRKIVRKNLKRIDLLFGLHFNSMCTMLHCALVTKWLLFTRALKKVMMEGDLVWNSKLMHCRFELTSHPLRHALICQRSDAGSIKLSSEVLIGNHLLALRRISLYEEENVRVYFIAA